MNGYRFFVVMRFLVGIIILIMAALAGFIAVIWAEVHRELSYRRQFGDQWRIEYENVFGPLSRGHTRIALCVIGFVAVVAITIWLIRILQKGQYASSRPRPRRRHGRSPVERTVRYRRNALLGIYFGVPGIIGSVALELIPLGIFRDFSDQQVIGIFVFVAGYVSVISGCWWWLKAKEWNEGVVLIGLMPLAIFFIPFVRLIFLAAPMLLLVGMVMMPIILIVVVWTLPDKSGTRRRGGSWITPRRDDS